MTEMAPTGLPKEREREKKKRERELDWQTLLHGL